MSCQLVEILLSFYLQMNIIVISKKYLQPPEYNIILINSEYLIFSDKTLNQHVSS